MLAFYVPFTVLALCIARLPWSRRWLWAFYAELTAMALVFSAVGFYQYQTRNVFENPKVVLSNAYARVLPGQLRVLGSVRVRAVPRRRDGAEHRAHRRASRSLRLAWRAAVVLVITWLGLLISFSQSSFAALVVAVIGVSAVAWRWKSLVAVGLAAAVLAGVAVAQPAVRRSIQHHTTSGLNSASSGRYSLVANGIRIAVAHPVRGVGVGGFKHAYAKRVTKLHGKKNLKTAASHDTPVTVSAETGGVGLALFAWLLVALGRDAYDGRRRIVALSAGLGLAAILVHSLFYNDFFEDPTTWLLLAFVALAVPPAAEAAPVRRTDEREAVAA